jgi:hypothetical protein
MTRARAVVKQSEGSGRVMSRMFHLLNIGSRMLSHEWMHSQSDPGESRQSLRAVVASWMRSTIKYCQGRSSDQEIGLFNL